MEVFNVQQGSGPVILAFPHTGTHVPDYIWENLNENGRLLADTDWHIEKLYAGLIANATRVEANFHRYVIDANRDPNDTSLYPGQNTTSLVPQTDFDGLAIWKEGREPNAVEIQRRLKEFHAPYHHALAAEISRVKHEHGVAVLYDCHSIRSHIPFLFAGKLPDFNIGTDMGTTCSKNLEALVVKETTLAKGYSSILNGRFKGGWTTRHYGQPSNNIHAIQMELAQCTHLSSEMLPFAYDDAKANKLRPHLQRILTNIESFALSSN